MIAHSQAKEMGIRSLLGSSRLPLTSFHWNYCKLSGKLDEILGVKFTQVTHSALAEWVILLKYRLNLYLTPSIDSFFVNVYYMLFIHVTSCFSISQRPTVCGAEDCKKCVALHRDSHWWNETFKNSKELVFCARSHVHGLAELV